MYEDLVKRLRDAAKMSDALAVLLPHSEWNATAKLYNEAADAIEELSKLADAIPHICECCIGCEVESGGCDNAFVLSPKRAREYMNKPRWIPATERLPDDLTRVIVFCEDGVSYGLCEHLIADDEEVIEWHDFLHYPITPTHWMPLPEPPKGE